MVTKKWKSGFSTDSNDTISLTIFPATFLRGVPRHAAAAIQQMSGEREDHEPPPRSLAMATEGAESGRLAST